VNPRQRRGLLLLGLALVGAVGVFITVSNYVAEVRSQVEPLTSVLQLRADVAAHEPITDDHVEEAQVPVRWVPETALSSRLELVGLVAAADLPAGSLLQYGMLVDAPAISPGQREIAILVDAETGVAGKVGPDDVVDIYATFEGDDEGNPPTSEIVVRGARVIDVGVPATQVNPEALGFDEGQVVPITFALSVFDSLVLTYVESFATNVRLGLVAPGDDGALDVDERRFRLEDLDGRGGDD
jgi:Flp pilus assembly protein CpaB